MPASVLRWAQRSPFAVVLLIALAIRLATLGAYPVVDLTDARYAEMARKMLETGNWLMPQFHYGVPFWGKPPLSIWLTAVSLKVFGVNAFGAHFPSFLVVLATAALVFYLARRRRDSEYAWTASAIFASTAATFILAGAVLMDPALTLGITLSMVSFWFAITEAERLWGYLFFVGLAFGVMAKGPVAVVHVGIPIFIWVLMRRQWSACWQRLPVITGTILLLALTVPWFVLAERATPGYLDYFIIGEHFKKFTVPGWSGDLYGHPHRRVHGSIWLDWVGFALPWSVLLIGMAVRSIRSKRQSLLAITRTDWQLYLLLWMISPMLFFMFSSNILWTYIYPGVPGLALLLAEFWQDRRSHKTTRLRAGACLIVPLSFLAVVTFVFPKQAPMRTEKFLVERYQQLDPQRTSHLIYIGERPFSAQFYMQGRALRIDGPEQLPQALATSKRDFFAVPVGSFEKLPDAVRVQLDPIGTYGRYELVRARGKP
jgi:4-amino-4-deoxy-L-arabinose transferase-like glycosyltransferase